MTENNNHQETRRHIESVLVVLVAIIAVLIIYLVANYWTLRREAIVARESWLSAFVAHHGVPTVNDVAFVRSWMTFDYLNKLFRIPSQYLQNTLAITDSRYPRLTISSYVRRNNLNLNAFMVALDDVLRAYVTKTAASSTVPTTSTI